MKKLLFTAAICLLIPIFVQAQATKILGTWYTEEGTSTVDVYKGTDGKYYGKISWLDEPYENGKPKVDDENPDPKMRTRPIMGLNLLNDFTYNAKKKQWTDGTIYDPDNGKTYDCYAWFEDGNYDKLYLKGYVLGMKFVGRSTIWKRKK